MRFTDFQFHPAVNSGIAACGYTTPTPIQEKAIPLILAGRDILGLAQTGTGKTAAFVLPLLQRLQSGPRRKVRALVVAPTRELAEQIHENIGKMAIQTGLKSAVVYGGIGKQPQIGKIRAGAEIIVACPGRLLDLLNEKVFNLDNIEVLILDEADHMLDKGFLPAIRRIIKQLPTKRQSLVFSATMPREICHLAEEILKDPARVQINHSLPAPTISHALFLVDKERKTALLKSIIREREMASTLVFTRTRHKAKSLALHLQKAGFSVSSLQGDLSQQKRQKALDGFRQRTFKILVATDIAARGIDIEGISHVINYDVPDTSETYTHRTGRTGRASHAGQALTFACQEDSRTIALIEQALGKKMTREFSPDFAGETEMNPGEERSEKPAGRSMPRKRKKGFSPGRRKTGNVRACSCDFGISRLVSR